MDAMKTLNSSPPLVTDPPRRNRRTGIRQCDIARAIKGAMQAGMNIREVIATPAGIRILSVASALSSSGPNDWDEVLPDG